MVVPLPEYRTRQRELVLKLLPHAIAAQCNSYFAMAMSCSKGNIAKSKILAPRGFIAGLRQGKEGLLVYEITKEELQILSQF